MLDVLTLAAPAGSVLLLLAEGEDETDAFESVRRLFASGFGEI
jgi:phosphotransferase system HPr-like phosphotransfer protein